jgi:hypothetical protein
MNRAEGPHLDPGSIAAYLDGALDDEQVAAVQEHLFACDECRDLVTDASGALQAARRRSRSWLVPTVAAAAVTGLLLIGLPLLESAADAPVVRGTADSAATTESGSRLEVVLPRPGTVLRSPEGRLVWRAAGTNANYAVTIADAGGDPVWQTETRDTAVAIPPSVGLEPDVTYLWYVDALTEDGRSVTTGVQRFRTSDGPSGRP